MVDYPTINYYGDHWGLSIIAFDKGDGSNIRVEYSQKNGFNKFGTRNQMIDGSHEPFGFVVDLFMEKYSEDLSKIFKSKGYRDLQQFSVFCELYGPNSAFGQHRFGEDVFDLVMFDVFENKKKSFIQPRQFVKDFGHLSIPEIVYEGNLNREFIQDVKENKFGLKEGVVCKGLIPNKKKNNLYYCKVKTNDWFERLRALNTKQYDEEIKQFNKYAKS